jgi:hypothetical protein
MYPYQGWSIIFRQRASLMFVVLAYDEQRVSHLLTPYFPLLASQT